MYQLGEVIFMKRRRNRINKYHLSEEDTFKERLKRSNPSPYEILQKNLVDFGKAMEGIGEKLKTSTRPYLDRIEESFKQLNTEDIISLIKEDGSDENSEERQIHD